LLAAGADGALGNSGTFSMTSSSSTLSVSPFEASEVDALEAGAADAEGAKNIYTSFKKPPWGLWCNSKPFNSRI